MTDRSYDRRAFAETYVLTQAPDDAVMGGYVRGVPGYNAALREHRARVLAGLEKLFGFTVDVTVRRPKMGDTALLWLFRGTVRSCLSPESPTSGFLEAGLLRRPSTSQPHLRGT